MLLKISTVVAGGGELGQDRGEICILRAVLGVAGGRINFRHDSK